ncbi:AAC(3) family N-acetyltransferase [Ktedonospora formicarum]
MSQEELIARTPEPRTRESLTRDLRQLGVEAGMTLIVHSSLSSLGWVSGGPVAVVQALMDVLTNEGTLVAPTQSGGLSDPTYWQNPPVPREWWPLIQETMPAYDPQTTPTLGMGAIVETFRNFPGVLRSDHPLVSLAAWGRHAEFITAKHSLNYALGENSPLARIYDLDGYILLLGVGYDRCTSLHLAEYRAPGSTEITQSAPIFEHGQRVWKQLKDIDLDSDIFPILGTEFEQQNKFLMGKVGSADARLFNQRLVIDFGVQWLTRQRQKGSQDQLA